MTDLKAKTAELKALGRLKATPSRVAEVKAALSGKWEGVQAVALQVLATWGGREAVEIIRAFLIDAYARKHGWSIRGVAIEALTGLIDRRDVDWVLDLYFSVPGHLEKHVVLRLVLALPSEAAKRRLVAELSSADAVNRQAAVKAIGNLPYADRGALLTRMCDDPDKLVRQSANALVMG
ncbi:hypothetical protein [Caulobacter sp. NIBR1757]|uniref:HEAT repeat domain-containing protein n=1 Tax=Caulobacter sp. NIBR1757 TaxID=3016000 RepID=UPI0022F09D25|nr:hypothetical protein [Caulobacter sp. NIBR1757]WGM40994.1 hypothetical protein AMEJIAPC_03941 [Caulobacter sp. NIBR1757]